MSHLIVQLEWLAHGSGLSLPTYQSEHAAAMDLAAAVESAVVITPGARMLIPCGFRMAVPHGYEAQVRPRSGLASRHGLTVINTPGTIDADYRGEVKVALVNLGTDAFIVERGMRIAQMLVTPVPRVEWDVVSELPDSVRGSGGFGHTGT
jgi:dUTP pyrophosphatase